MCRMLLASGEFDVAQIIDSALAMARGEYSPANAPTHVHPDGFGILWTDPGTSNGFRILKSQVPLGECTAQEIIDEGGPSLVKAGTLAIHARFALLPHQRGMNYIQPLSATRRGTPLFFMHNGFTPQMHHCVGLQESHFDSEEYFEFVRSVQYKGNLDVELCHTLEKMSGNTASANFFLLSHDQLLAFNWWPASYDYPEYAQMHRYDASSFTVISSEKLPTIAPTKFWKPLSRGKLERLGRSR